ncbi:MAG: hypothetical protein QGF09_14905 [Rhodospirillales bacterium]|jgi:hypothetical protein|nr:hypothetical protein [Rhodospirillales bacterium]
MGLFWDRRKKERRKTEDRRQKNTEPVEAERRQSERRVSERRVWSCGILYRTSEQSTVLEEWMEKNCRGKWNLRLDGVDEQLMGKSFKLMFELPEDKNNFIRYFSRRP